ncbi:MAG: tetratricopeptide repeat protein [Fusobacteriaceae bacterium]|nr:tetratricopeptide repeat protein [Fusobacteriaceae bacterium]
MNIKLLSVTVVSLLIVGCTGGGGRSRGGGYGMYTGISRPVAAEKLPRERITLTESTPTRILDELSADMKNNKSRTTIRTTDVVSAASYIGEYLYIPLAREDSTFRMVSSPKNSSYDLRKVTTNLIFRSIYEGNFVTVVTEGASERRITISNSSRYEFSESELREIVIRCFDNRNYTGLKDSVALYKIIFPNGAYTKDNSMRLLEAAGASRDARTVRSEYNFLKKYSTFSGADRKMVADALYGTGVTDVAIDGVLLEYSSMDRETNEKVANVLLAKDNITRREAEFLEQVYRDTPDERIASYVGNWYLKNGDPVRGQRYVSGAMETPAGQTPGTLTPGGASPLQQLAAKNYETFQGYYTAGEQAYRSGNYASALDSFQKALSVNKNYTETARIYYYMGQCNYNTGKYQVALNNYRSALLSEKTAERQAELYYNLGLTSQKLGNISECRNYLTYIRQKFPGSSWSEKSTALLSTLN